MFDPRIAETRFGTGLSPVIAPPTSIDQMINGLLSSDAMAMRFPFEPFDTFKKRVVAYRASRQQERRSNDANAAEVAKELRQTVTRDARSAYDDMFTSSLLRRVHSDTGFRERLTYFWADHFTAYGRAPIVKWATSAYVEDAIRPNIAGSFADMLVAAVTHPLMLNFLNQSASVGPESVVGRVRGVGLNENLAREVLELHTLGVDGPYRQADVRELAELFTGLSIDRNIDFRFRIETAEPGAETVLGQTYAQKASFENVSSVLRDLAMHPETARHLALKLLRYFVSGTPDAALVERMAASYLAHDGSLLALYTEMLSHGSSWMQDAQNVKAPVDFIATSLRALNIGQAHLSRLRANKARQYLYVPLQLMGQPWEKPIGPDGWPDDSEHWISPQFLAARMTWALTAPLELATDLPDPRRFARIALGDALTEDVAFAASAAENRWEGIALVLMSPAFQRF